MANHQVKNTLQIQTKTNNKKPHTVHQSSKTCDCTSCLGRSQPPLSTTHLLPCSWAPHSAVMTGFPGIHTHQGHSGVEVFNVLLSVWLKNEGCAQLTACHPFNPQVTSHDCVQNSLVVNLISPPSYFLLPLAPAPPPPSACLRSHLPLRCVLCWFCFNTFLSVFPSVCSPSQ